MLLLDSGFFCAQIYSVLYMEDVYGLIYRKAEEKYGGNNSQGE